MPFHRFFHNLFRRRHRKLVQTGIDLDEIFLDARNLPSFNTHQFEGRLAKPLSRSGIVGIAIFFLLAAGSFSARLFSLQVARGDDYRALGEENRLHHTLLFAERGIIYDRGGKELAWNTPGDKEFPDRAYTRDKGLGHVLGYVGYPSKDTAGFYYTEDFIGHDGAERAFDALLRGRNGLKIVETDAHLEVKSQSTLRPPEAGGSVFLSIDARVQGAFSRALEEAVEVGGFRAGAGVMMDVRSGELIALTSYPEYDPDILTNRNTVRDIAEYQNDPRLPFLNRAVGGLYAPGSIVKPFIALAALEEGVVTPETVIVSTGSLSIPNPYVAGSETVFRDWKAHGAVDLRSAIAVSSDVYFYQIGGGFGRQKGLGIERIGTHMRLFGLASSTGIDLLGEETGVIPSLAWKEEHFPGDPWRIGNTYHTAIGQYGFQTTPLAAARATAAIANGGTMVTPRMTRDAVGPADAVRVSLPYSEKNMQVVREGMRRAVTEGTAQGLSASYVTIAAKTGTAEVGIEKDRIHGWLIGFFPYEKPRYSFAIVLESGPAGSPRGGVFVARSLFDWMARETPEYFGDSE